MFVSSTSPALTPTPFGSSPLEKADLARAEEPGKKSGEDQSAPVKREQNSENKTSKGKALSAQDLKQIETLKDRDREVRAHEAAHLAASGGLARGGASFSYKRGPDGNLYAIGGEVSIDISPVSGEPEATIRKAETIKRAALAPANPSSQDRSVAASAAQMEASARMELLKQQQTASKVSAAYANAAGAKSSSRLDIAA